MDALNKVDREEIKVSNAKQVKNDTVEDVVIDSYLKEKLNMRNRNVYFDEGGFDDKE